MIVNKANRFHYKDILIETHPEVYDPAEDTFLLLDSIDIKKEERVLEIGAGCGIIGLFCAKIGADVICTDINPISVELIKKNYLINQNKLKGNFEIRFGDMFSAIQDYDSFDTVIFNPPYLPTKKEDLTASWIDVSTSGGELGLDLTKRYIESLSKHLKEEGDAYFIFSSQCDKKELIKIIEKNNYDYIELKSQNFENETLTVFKIKKIKREVL